MPLRTRVLRLVPAFVVACLVLRPTPLWAQFGYTGSAHVVRVETADGDRTDAAYLFTSLDLETGPVRTSVTLPVVAQSLRWADPNAGLVETGWQAGLADPIIRVDGRIWRHLTGASALRVSGAVKLPVASREDGFSSGKVDAAVGLSVTTSQGRNSLLADVTYWIFGDPEDMAYRNVPAVYIGYARVLDRQYRWSGILSVSAAPSAIPDLGAPAQVSAALLRAVGRRGAVGVSVDVGLTDNAADLAVGSLWRFTF